MRKSIQIFMLVIFLGLGSFIQAQTNNGLIVSFSVEGASSTELSSLKSGEKTVQFKQRIFSKTETKLKSVYKFDSLVFAPNESLEIKNSLNRFKGVRKINDEEKALAKNYACTFKIKCDIAFNESNVGIILNEKTSRAVVYLAIGVFNQNGEQIAIYKGKSKDQNINIGENQVNSQWLSMQDFEYLFENALLDLEKD